MLCLVASLDVLATGKQEAGAKPITLKVAVRNYTLDYDAPWKTGAAGFQKLHPNVKIELEGLPYNEMRDKVLIAVSAGKGPDIAFLDCIWLGEYASNKIIIPLTKQMNANPELKNDLYPAFLAGATWKGEIYGPWSHTDTRTLVWNKDMFKASGLDPENPPKTWGELREYAKRLTDPAKDIWGFGFPAFASEGSLDMWYPFVFQGGKNILSDDNTKAIFNQPHGVAALQLYYDLMYTDKASPKDLIGVEEGQHTDGFDAGKYAMIVMAGTNATNDAYKGLTRQQFEAKVGAAAYPVGPGGQIATGSGGWILGITRDSKNPDTAWEFLKYALRSDNLLEFVVADADMATYKSIAENPKYKDYLVHYGVRQGLVNSTHFRPPVPEYLKIADLIVNAMQKVLTEKASPQQAMDEAAKAADALLAQRKW
jgi:multiple sugar transport system substrate-binding protein